MTREEVKQMLMVIDTQYPYFSKDKDLESIVSLWSKLLEPYNSAQMSQALYNYILSDKKGYAPTIGMLVDIYNSMERQELSETEAWSLVDKAVRNSTYHAQEEFEKLPRNVQLAVATPDQLAQWAKSDIMAYQTVVQANFMRSYKSVCERERHNALMPADVQSRIEQQRSAYISNQQVAETFMIEKNETYANLSQEQHDELCLSVCHKLGTTAVRRYENGRKTEDIY